MCDKWKHDNWHNNQANRQKFGKCKIPACPYCEIKELEAQAEDMKQTLIQIKDEAEANGSFIWIRDAAIRALIKGEGDG